MVAVNAVASLSHGASVLGCSQSLDVLESLVVWLLLPQSSVKSQVPSYKNPTPLSSARAGLAAVFLELH